MNCKLEVVCIGNVFLTSTFFKSQSRNSFFIFLEKRLDSFRIWSRLAYFKNCQKDYQYHWKCWRTTAQSCLWLDCKFSHKTCKRSPLISDVYMDILFSNPPYKFPLQKLPLQGHSSTFRKQYCVHLMENTSISFI